MNKLIIVDGVLDPTKKMKFFSKCFENLYVKDSDEATQLTKDTEDILKSLFDEYNISYNKDKNGGSAAASVQSQSQGTSSQSQDHFVEEVSQRKVLGNGVAYESMNDIYDELGQEAGFQETINELDLYLKESVENHHVMNGTEYDVLSWWRGNSGKYPVLSLLARDIFAMQVSSVASESAFSTSGRVLDPSRSCLTHYIIEVLMCTEQWLKCEIKVYGRGIIRQEQLLKEVEAEDELMREFEHGFNF
ncbi:HAT protein [Hirschfeldia incana]|nr:HAT protein [Hirschfeldia incana]